LKFYWCPTTVISASFAAFYGPLTSHQNLAKPKSSAYPVLT
jgi:hypothetical protein